MKISTILMVVFTLNLSANGFGQFSFTAEGKKVREVFDIIEKESNYRFFYNDEFESVDEVVDLKVINQNINQVLDRLLISSDYTYKVFENNLIVISLKDNILEESDLQQNIVKGTITDEKGDPLAGVSIVIKGTTRGTVSDVNGNYTIQADNINSILLFSFIGYKNQEVIIGNRAQVNISLEEELVGLDEVVVIGYGTQSRATITTSITKLDNKVFDNVPFMTAASALQGNVSGVLVQSSSGQPGQAPTIIIRGGTSIDNPSGAAPLYIIDGVINDNMDNLSPSDIESIQILKDAASTSIYGARGSNGVVLVTTKTGKTGQFTMNYKYDVTLGEVGKLYDLADAHDYIYYTRVGYNRWSLRHGTNPTSYLNDKSSAGTGNDLTNTTTFTTQYLTPDNQHKLNEGWESMPDPIDSSKTIIYKETDWQAVTFQTGVTHNHYVSASGGTDRANINIGLGYLENEGIAITTGYNRLTLSSYGNVKVRDNLSFNSRIRYFTSDQKSTYGEDYIFGRSNGIAPSTKYTFEDGTLAPGPNLNRGNPAYHLPKLKSKNLRDNLSMSVGGEWDILPGLSFRPLISWNKSTTDLWSFREAYENGAAAWVYTRPATATYTSTLRTQSEAVLNYIKTFASSHNLNLTAGVEYNGLDYYYLRSAGQDAVTDLIPTLNAVKTMTAMTSNTYKTNLLGYFGRINYNYKEKYLLSGTCRYDGASQLGDLNKWGFFPGVSAGWIVNKENFWSEIIPKDLINLKLRLSYGVNGNIGGLTAYQAQGGYIVGNQYMGTAAIEHSVIPNQDLKWEESATLNFGVDLGFFSDRVRIFNDIYRRVTNDLITSLTLPPSTGFKTVSTNYGSLENKGFETEININMLPPKSRFRWNVSFIASHTKHKILKLPYNGAENNRVGGYYIWDPAKGAYGWLGGLQEGGRIGDMYAYKQTGVYSTDEEAASAPIDLLVTSANKKKYGGDAIFLDNDKNDTIDIRDISYVGNPFPTWTGGFTSTFSYKGFDLFVRMDYMLGHTIYNRAYLVLANRSTSYVNIPQFMVTEGWHEQGDIAKYPEYHGLAEFNTSRGDFINSVFYEPGDFLCVREITLSYLVPKKILNRLKINNLRLNVTGNNLHYFTKYLGMNPEAGGTDAGRYPLAKEIIFGASVTF